MITEIGALVVILKDILESSKTGLDLFGVVSKKRTVEGIEKTQERLAGIAEQLYQSVSLSKMLPIWLREHSRYDLYQNILSNDDVKLLDSGLRSLISDSIHDHFSATFFQTSFAALPGAEAAIEEFRDRLSALENQLNGIPPGDATAWRRTWPILKVRMHDLRVEAVKLNNLADTIHSELIVELREAAQAPVRGNATPGR
jgi:hypothetical protein